MQPRSICKRAGSAQLPSSPWGSCSGEPNQPKAVPPSSFLGWLFFLGTASAVPLRDPASSGERGESNGNLWRKGASKSAPCSSSSLLVSLAV